MDALKAWLRERGPGVTLLYAAHRVLTRISGGQMRLVPYALYAQPIGQSRQSALRPDPHTVLRPLTPQDALCAELPRPASVIAARFERGAQCHAAVVKERLGGTIWIARGAYDEDEVRCLYRLAQPENSVWDFDVYVEPRLRLSRAMARLWHHVDTELAAEGVRWTFSRISLFNASSLSAHARLGATCVGHATFLVIGPLQLSVHSGAPYLYVSWSDRRRPVVRLQPPAPAPKLM